MGAGKSSGARLAGTRLGLEVLDADALLEERLGAPVAHVFERDGEAAFRAAEEQLVLELLDAPEPAAIALGGGAVLSPAVRDALLGHVAVLLEVDLETAWGRASGRGGVRPLARDPRRFRELFHERRPLYEGCARAFVPAGDRAALPAALPWLDALRDPGLAAIRLVWAPTRGGGYPVLLGPRAAGLRLDVAPPGRPFLVTDERVGPLHAARVAPPVASVAVAPGEEHKTLETVETVCRALARAGMTRGDHVVALGGGVVGDLAGFCAASYQRGVPVVQVPTTVVAQVDSAYGGKTGVDLPEGKNYVGAYHQPAAVLVDPEPLATLPQAERSAGYAEALKTALIAGGDLWNRVRAGADVDPEVVLDCARTKIAIVARDERDGGARQLLNLGHTVAHAIETVTGYARLRHGEAVGLGLLAALRLSGLASLREEVAELLRARRLPLRLDSLDVDAVVAATARDKKRASSREGVPFVLVRAPGDVRTGGEVSDATLRLAVAELKV